MSLPLFLFLELFHRSGWYFIYRFLVNTPNNVKLNLNIFIVCPNLENKISLFIFILKLALIRGLLLETIQALHDTEISANQSFRKLHRLQIFWNVPTGTCIKSITL